MDFKKLAQVNTSKITDSSKKTSEERKKEILDSIKARRAARKASQIADSKVYKKFRVTDAYKNLKRKIKDDLEETETTDEAIETALSEITPEAPAEQVLSAVIEVLGDTIDDLQEQVDLGEGDEDVE